MKSKKKKKAVNSNKTEWYWRKNGQIYQWNRKDNPEIYPHKYSKLIFDKGAKAIQWRKDSLLNKWCQNNWISACQKDESRHRPYTLHKN